MRTGAEVNPKRKEVREGCRKLNIEKFHNLFSSPNIMKGTNCGGRKEQQIQHAVHRRHEKFMLNISRKSEGRDKLGYIGVHIMLILNGLERLWTELLWHTAGTDGELFSRHPDSKNNRKLLDQLNYN